MCSQASEWWSLRSIVRTPLKGSECQSGSGVFKASKDTCKSAVARKYLWWEQTGCWTLELFWAQEVPGSFLFWPARPWVVTVECGNSLNGLVFTGVLWSRKVWKGAWPCFPLSPTFLLPTPHAGVKSCSGCRKTMLLLSKYKLSLKEDARKWKVERLQ